jgi:tetratricopeptide (TPR) repeat protein
MTQLRGWLSSKLYPWFAPYWEAKKLHEGSPHGLFPRTFYHALTAEEILAAVACPRLARAITLYQACIEREKKAERCFNEGVAMQQLGLVLLRQAKLAAARQVFEQALDILEDLPNEDVLPVISTCHFRLAEIYLENGDKQTAGMHLERCRSIDESLNDKSGLALNAELGRLISG